MTLELDGCLSVAFLRISGAGTTDPDVYKIAHYIRKVKS